MVVEGLDRLEGVPRGSAALFLKIHHAVMDGKSALRLITGLHSPGPEPGTPTFADSMADEEPIDQNFQPPSWWEKYGRAWWHSIERPVNMAATLVKLLPQLLHQEDPGTKGEGQVIPQLRFNRPVAADRIVGHVRMEMQLVRKIEKKFHCTINDIALCVVAGALRAYLLEEDELPDENLQALMPIDIRREGRDGHIGNQVSVARVCLNTIIDDAGKRLQAISKVSSQSKKRRKKTESHALLKLIDDIHPAIILWLGQWLVDSGHIDDLPPFVNTIVTNVPGLSSDAYLAGAKLIDYLGFGPLAPGMGLFHTVSSTPDHVNVSFLSTEEFMGDGSAYRAALVRSWTDLSGL